MVHSKLIAKPQLHGALVSLPLVLAALFAVSATMFTVPVRAQAQLASKALQSLQNSANAHFKAGNLDAALGDAEKALALAIKEFGPTHEQIAIRTYSLGLIAEAAGRDEAAAGYFRHSVEVREKVYGRDSAGTAQALEMLGRALLRAGSLDDAERQFQRVLTIRSELVGSEHSFTASARADLGRVQLARGNAGSALLLFRDAVRLLTSEKVEQTVAQMVTQQGIRRQRAAFTGLAAAAWASRSAPGANRVGLMTESYTAAQQAWSTSAASALAKMAARLGTADTALGRQIRRVQDISERVLKLHEADMQSLAAWSEVQRKDRTFAAIQEEFRQAAYARQKENAPIVKQQKALVEDLQALMKRCPPGTTKPLAGCEASQRELATITDKLSQLGQATSRDGAALMALHRRLETAERALPGYQQFTSTRQARLSESQQLEAVLRETRTRITSEFPEYVALTDPKPLNPVETQALLRPDETLVSILVGETESFVWAVNRQRASWARIEAGERELARHVAELRRGLDPLSADPVSGQPNAVKFFDADRAYALYRLILAPVATLIAGKQHLMIVATGPLASLPFQVLVAEKPNANADPAQKVREAKWLIRRHALSVLPSVQALQALRTLRPAALPPKPFVGIGDPAFTGPVPQQGSPGRGAARLVHALKPSSLYRGGSVDLRALSQLVPLPDTAIELKSIARALGASDADLLLRNAATETRVKQATLSDYRVLQFATHGLVAGELSGLTEPALVLTPPAVATNYDDGLLSASEVAALQLQADWVVLSACNTAAGETTGADALSGLARAFFYAGARALLVSHWAVYSDAAVALTTGTFAQLAQNAKLGRAEAFRRTMIDMIDKGEPPSVWAPFVIVGEGGTPRPAPKR